MKKLLSVCLLLILIVSMSINSYATISANLVLNTSKEEYSKGDTFEVEVSLSNISSNNGGVRALGGYLIYDKTNLELVEFKGTDYWTKPTYNAEKGKFLTDRSAATLNPNEKICTIVFKVKTENASNVSVKLQKIEIASVNEEQILTDVEKLLTIKPVSNANQNNGGSGDSGNQGQTQNPSTPEQNNGNNSGNNDQNNGTNNAGNTEKPKDNSVANTVLPAAGANETGNSMAKTITLIIVVPIAVSLVAFVIIVLIVERRIFG